MDKPGKRIKIGTCNIKCAGCGYTLGLSYTCYCQKLMAVKCGAPSLCNCIKGDFAWFDEYQEWCNAYVKSKAKPVIHFQDAQYNEGGKCLNPPQAETFPPVPSLLEQFGRAFQPTYMEEIYAELDSIPRIIPNIQKMSEPQPNLIHRLANKIMDLVMLISPPTSIS